MLYRSCQTLFFTHILSTFYVPDIVMNVFCIYFHLISIIITNAISISEPRTEKKIRNLSRIIPLIRLQTNLMLSV